mgnify:CR=1 FL=1
MNFYALFALTFIPLAATFLIVVILVPGQKIRWALWACLVGLFTVAPTSFVQYYVLNLPIFYTNTVISLLITAVIFNGLIEETFKMLFMNLLPQKKLTPAQFFTCCLLCGMTLGSFESVIYMVKRIQETAYPLGIQEIYKLIVSRMFTSVLIHTFCAVLSGMYLWLFRHKSNKIMPFIWAVLLHGTYNFFAGFKSGFYWFAIISIVFAALECRIWYKFINLPDTGVDLKRKYQ